MKHVKDAQEILDKGDSAGAMVVLENLLGLAPRNPDALRLKALILDGWGRFDDSLNVFKTLSQLPSISDAGLKDLENCSAEEKEAFVYSELTSEGRWYFAFPKSQVWISLYGFVGCGLFLLISPGWLSQGADGFAQLILGFFLFVLAPWLALMVVHCVGVKKILVGIQGIRLCKRFSEKQYTWQQLQLAMVEHDNDISKNTLSLSLYEKVDDKEPILTFNISKDNCVVRARRHFVRNILNYVDTVCYINRDLRNANDSEAVRVKRAVGGDMTPVDPTSERDSDSSAA